MAMISQIILLLYCLSATRGSVENVRLDDASGEADLTHLLLDNQTGRIFAAGRNSLHQLNSHLKVERLVRTGPLEDSVHCSARGSCQLGAEKSPTDNHNKALLLEPEERILIACGSLFQGVCERYLADDISQKLPTITVPIVPNDGGSSAVVFIGPGLPDARSHRVLYAASQHTQLGPYRSQEEVPAVSSRNLQNHEIVRARRFVQARIKIASQSLETFRVHYVTGFYHEGFAYFVTVQPNNVDNPDEGFVSKLVRVCANDPSYESYMEITLSCQSKGLKYNLVQSAQLISPGSLLAQQLKSSQTNKVIVASFSASEAATNLPKSTSAICIFNMKDVEEIFERNAQLCFSGARSGRGLGFIAGANLPCPKDPRVVTDFCGEHLLIEGTLPLVSEALIVYSDQLITTLAAANSPQHTVIFAGTRNGLVKKILVKSRHVGHEYASIKLNLPKGSQAAVRQLLIDSQQQTAYILTKNHVSKIPVADCESHSSCGQCLQSQDPFCGWCSLEKRCTPRESCSRLASLSMNERDSSQSPSRWLPFNAHRCIDLVALTPDQLPISHPSTLVRLKIPELPHMHDQSYSCIFGDSMPVPANRTKDGLTCLVDKAMIAKTKIPKNQDFASVEVAVRSHETKQDFVSKAMFVYDCSVHKRCSTCATSKWNCSWCPTEGTCVDQAESCKGPKITNQLKTLNRVQQESCPVIRGETATSLMIPNMIPQSISLKVQNMPNTAKNALLECVVDIEGKSLRTSATVLSGGKVTCNEAVYFYDAEVEEVTASLSLVWNWNNVIDSVNVTVYKCRLKGPDCGICLTRSPEYGCAWLNDECRFDPARSGANQTCPSPSIDSIFPVSGPVEGGTKITIIGRELGMRIEDVNGAIRVADVPCVPIEYEISRKIVCRTLPVPHNGPRSGPLTLSLPNRPAQTSYQKFYFLNTTVYEMSPRLGPRSGGTRVTISGSQLDIGSEIEVTIGGLPCEIEEGSITTSQLICKTSPAPSAKMLAQGLVVTIDDSSRKLDADFQYMNDPVLNDIEPLTAFVSGGTQMTFFGERFNVVSMAGLVVKLKDNEAIVNQTRCDILSPRSIICPAPSIEKWLLSNSRRFKRGFIEQQETSWQFEALLVLDGWKSQPMVISYVPNPVVFPFAEKGGYKVLHDVEEIVVEGERLNEAASDQDFVIQVQNDLCNITLISERNIHCLPSSLIGAASARLQVTVQVGNLMFNPGYIIYSPSVEASPSSSFDSVTGIAVGSGVLFVVCVLVLLIYRRKTSQAEREYKRIQLQMDTLENHVRMECKQAFTELQTDISDIAVEVQMSGIPYWDNRMYAMKVFFPLSHNHPVLHDIRSCRNNRCTGFESAMSQFEQLLSNKQFLLNFISTLESQKTFGIRDRANVASLLMVVFMDRLDYMTEVFRDLLIDLMQKSVASRHPQVMLRRAESVVEKMLSNWIALSMGDYVRQRVGSQLFVLFQAIKCQVEKGPVDCLTHDARYSLSEDRLLREQILYHPVIIHLHQDDLDEKIQCRVLDCDSISQVKSKLLDALYKTTPSSTRPSVYEIDLEWHNSQHGRIILQDEDATSEFGDGWRRINTLRHYGIQESAVMTLVLKSCPEPYYQAACEISPYSMTAPGLSSRDYGTGKVWHLTKGIEGQWSTSNSMNSGFNTVPEIFLTRLLSTKGTLQKYIDDLFRSMLNVSSDVPLPIKWLFDLFDECSRDLGITDPEVVHAWKSNSVPLRFWVNIIKNPEFLFDVQKTPTVDACLSVIAQSFMDSCTLKDHLRLNKDSPSNKLLFAKDIPHIRGMVQGYYEGIRSLPSVDDRQLFNHMAAVSKSCSFNLNSVNGLKELFSYAAKYSVEISEKLESDPMSQPYRLGQQFEMLCRSGNYFTLPMNNCL